MRVFLSLSEWSSCNCFSLEQLEAAQRNRIETTFAFKMSWDGEEGGRAALLPYTEQLYLCSLFLFSPPLLYCLPLSIPPSTLSAPTTTPTSAHSQHGSPRIVFRESSKVDVSLLIRAGYCMISVGMDELICARECVHNCVCACAFPMWAYSYNNMWLCVAVFLIPGTKKGGGEAVINNSKARNCNFL